jgi:hypothetical protein
MKTGRFQELFELYDEALESDKSCPDRENPSKPLKSQEDTIVDLQKEVRTLKLAMDTEANKSASNQQALLQVLLPFAEVGIPIRGRVLEKTKSRSMQNDSVIQKGNLAAHQGDPFTDALLFHPTLEALTGIKCRKDTPTYVRMYGFPAASVATNPLTPRREAFDEMLRLKFGMKTMQAAHIQRHPTATEPKEFGQAYKKVTINRALWGPEQFEELLVKSEDGKASLTSMRSLYNVVLEAYNKIPWSSEAPKPKAGTIFANRNSRKIK